MSDLICRKTMTRCQTPGMCAPFGGCHSGILVKNDVRYAADAQYEPAAMSAVTAEAKRLQAECLALLSERDQLRAAVEHLRQQAARYERLRRLDPRQFAELHQRCLAGERFDWLVDGLEAKK